jgi:hypothetical protein
MRPIPLAAAVVGTLFAAQPAKAASHSVVYNRALRCAANTDFMLAELKERGDDDSSDWFRTARARADRWMNVAVGLAEVPPASVSRERLVMATKALPAELARRPGDPEQAFQDYTEQEYNGCVDSPPAAEPQASRYAKSIQCAAVTGFMKAYFIWTKSGSPAVLDALQKDGDYWIGSAVATGVASAEDVSANAAIMQSSIQQIYDSRRSVQVQGSAFLDETNAEVLKCLAAPKGQP